MNTKLQRVKERKIERCLRALAAAHGFELVRPGAAVTSVTPVRAPEADPRQVELPHHVRSCLRHDECDLADEIARRNGRHAADHCHDQGCEQCKREAYGDRRGVRTRSDACRTPTPGPTVQE